MEDWRNECMMDYVLNYFLSLRSTKSIGEPPKGTLWPTVWPRCSLVWASPDPWDLHGPQGAWTSWRVPGTDGKGPRIYKRKDQSHCMKASWRDRLESRQVRCIHLRCRSEWRQGTSSCLYLHLEVLLQFCLPLFPIYNIQTGERQPCTIIVRVK